MNTTGFTIIDLFVLIVYLIAVLVAGLYFSKKEMKGKEFFKGDGSVPWYVTSVSIFATMLSPISFLGLAGNSYAGSWILWFAQLGMLIAIPLAIKYVLPIFARMDIDTAYDYLERRYEAKSLRVISAILFIIYQLGRISIIMYLPSVGLATLTGIDINILIILMGVIAIIYSYTGGLKSVLWTDFIQGVILSGGALIALFVLIYDVDGGIGAITQQLAHGKFIAPTEKIFDPNILSSSIFLIVVGSGLTIFSSYASSQDLVQRFTTTQSISKLNKMLFTNGALSLGIATVFLSNWYRIVCLL
ncbi:sodium:solute symporter family transporter [Staphylococcus coagulans]|uniref:sodium:solute symporter family transporter n=1 Tax=Staphylococcus coagulans TaxID=74706 RepID=UPI00240D7098